MVMMKDRVVLGGISANMWAEEQNEKLKKFLTDSSYKQLILRVEHGVLVS